MAEQLEGLLQDLLKELRNYKRSEITQLLYSKKAAAARLGISPRKLDGWIDAGYIPVVRPNPGEHPMIGAKALAAFETRYTEQKARERPRGRPSGKRSSDVGSPAEELEKLREAKRRRRKQGR